MKKEIPWYSEEAGLFTDDYFKMFGDQIPDPSAEIDFIEKTLNLKPGTKIFDLCCGHGRHSIELARRGYDVTGQDISQYFLDIAKGSAEKAGVKIKLVHDDMRNIRFSDEFDAAIIMFTSFGVLESDSENQKVLNGLSASLKQGGKLCIDAANRDRIISRYLSKDHKYLKDGSLLVIEREFDHISGYHRETRKIYSSNGSCKEYKVILRFYTVPELINMFKNAGLEIIDYYGDFDFTPISFSSPNYILIAEKNN
jgi:ubiquinone/menaquinone biosynthesis C-methylase UbiE